mgnify:CR=1 FL=1
MPGVNKVVKPVLNVANTVATAGLQTFSGGTYGLAAGLVNNTLNKPAPVAAGGPMALNIGGILQSVSGGLKGFQAPAAQLVSLGTGIASQFFPQPMANYPAVPMNSSTPVMAKAPQVVAPAVGAAVSRGFFSRFPNLSVGLQQLKNRGIKVNRARLYSLLRRFGPEVLITGGLLTAAAVNELMVAGAGRRRMNVGNIKALKRSMRRMEGFHKLCMRADKLRSTRRRVKC